MILSILGMSVAGLIGAVALGVAAGIIIAKILILTFTMLTNKIKQKLAKRNVSKVAVGEISEIVKNCKNQKTIADLMAMQNQGITHFAAEVQENGTVAQDGIEAWNVGEYDNQVYNAINETGEGMLVVNS